MNDNNEPPRLEYPPGATKEAKAKMLREWAPKMELWRLKQALEYGSEWMQWLTCEDGRVCDHCAKMNRVVVKAIHVDVLKHMRGCTNPSGCRCICGPVSGPNEPTAGEVTDRLAANGITITLTSGPSESMPISVRRKTKMKTKPKKNPSKLYSGIGTDSCGIPTYRLD